MRVEMARVNVVGSSEVDSSEKISLSENVVQVLLAVGADTVKEGSGFLPSWQTLCRCHQRVCHQRGIVEVDCGSWLSR